MSADAERLIRELEIAADALDRAALHDEGQRTLAKLMREAAAALADDVDALARRCKAAEESYAIGRRLVDELRAALASATAELREEREDHRHTRNAVAFERRRAEDAEKARDKFEETLREADEFQRMAEGVLTDLRADLAEATAENERLADALFSVVHRLDSYSAADVDDGFQAAIGEMYEFASAALASRVPQPVELAANIDQAMAELPQDERDAYDAAQQSVVDARRVPQPDLPSHLRDDAPYLVCSGCGRKSWALQDRECGMPQPDGTRCLGVFRVPHPEERFTMLDGER
jgi:chromosome segregation ATPase